MSAIIIIIIIIIIQRDRYENSNILLTIISNDLDYLTVLCSWVLSDTRLLDFHLNILVGALQLGRPARAAAPVQAALNDAPRLDQVEEDPCENAEEAGDGAPDKDH